MHSATPPRALWLGMVGVLAGAFLVRGLASLGLPDALAGTISGTAVTVSGLDNLSATVQSYAKGNVGKFTGILLGVAGMAGIASGRPGTGALGLTAGVGLAFLPNIMGSAFDATSAAPLGGGGVPQVWTTWWAPLLGLAYPLAVGLKLLLDPVVWVCQALVLWRHQRASGLV